ncbi:MAG: hypothetical protein PHV30_08560 [Candidatus Margulisbacteria bacterium]|nr:hypothetical protein [Candidatus Margulisiibacteriota bacterium]
MKKILIPVLIVLFTILSVAEEPLPIQPVTLKKPNRDTLSYSNYSFDNGTSYRIIENLFKTKINSEQSFMLDITLYKFVTLEKNLYTVGFFQDSDDYYYNLSYGYGAYSDNTSSGHLSAEVGWDTGEFMFGSLLRYNSYPGAYTIGSLTPYLEYELSDETSLLAQLSADLDNQNQNALSYYFMAEHELLTDFYIRGAYSLGSYIKQLTNTSFVKQDFNSWLLGFNWLVTDELSIKYYYEYINDINSTTGTGHTVAIRYRL